METYTKDTDITKGKVLLFFSGPNCGFCKMVKPGIEKLASEGKTDFKILVVDTGDPANLEIARKYGVRALPTVIALKDGEPSRKLVGAGEVQPKKLTEAF